MNVTIADPATLSALSAAFEGVELRSPDGRTLGRFVPSLETTLAAFGMTVEEHNRRRNAPASEWVTGDEVMARLRSLKDQP